MAVARQTLDQGSDFPRDLCQCVLGELSIQVVELRWFPLFSSVLLYEGQHLLIKGIRDEQV
jgi:hypothetical protein